MGNIIAFTRREFLKTSTVASATAWFGVRQSAAEPSAKAVTPGGRTANGRRVIDFHLHVKHSGRDLRTTIAHIAGLGCEKAVP